MHEVYSGIVSDDKIKGIEKIDNKQLKDTAKKVNANLSGNIFVLDVLKMLKDIQGTKIFTSK